MLKTIKDAKKHNYKNNIINGNIIKSFKEFLDNPSSFSFQFENKTTYNKKNNFKNESNKENLVELDIKHLSYRKKDSYSNKVKIIKNIKKFDFKKCKSKEDLKEEQYLLNKIFPENIELNKYTNLPFFCLTKKKLNFSNDEKKNQKLLKEDFIYKLSHGERFFSNDIISNINNNNFIRNKSIKKGLTVNYTKKEKKKDESSLPELKLELDINSINNKNGKIPQISNKEKYLLFVKNKLNDLKTGNIFKKFEEEIFKFKEENELSNKNDGGDNNKEELKIKDNTIQTINKNKNINKVNMAKTIKVLKKVKSCIDKSILNTNYLEIKNDNYYPSLKKPLKYPINFYTSRQLEIKKKRYEKAHKEGWKEFKRKINTRNLAYNSNKNIKNPMVLCVLEPNRNLQKKKVMTNKLVYLHDCRIRDILITNKLKFEYNKDDIKRILNGQKPWKELESENEKKI